MSVDFQTIVNLAAADVRRRFFGYVDREDLLSEAWIWRLQHEKRFESYDRDENEKRAGYRLLRDVTMQMEKFARAEKAQHLGYNVQDEAYYGSTLIGLILPSVLHKDLSAPQAEASEGKGNSDPAEGGTWMAHLVDVKHAWTEATLTDKEREALLLYYGMGQTLREIEETLGIDHSTAGARIESGLKKMSATLGGERLKGCPYDCECHEDRLRIRPGIHSEASGKNQELR